MLFEEIVTQLKRHEGWTWQLTGDDQLFAQFEIGKTYTRLSVRLMPMATRLDRQSIRVRHHSLVVQGKWTDRERTVTLKKESSVMKAVVRGIKEAQDSAKSRENFRLANIDREDERGVVMSHLRGVHGTTRGAFGVEFHGHEVKVGSTWVSPNITIRRKEGESVGDFAMRSAHVLANLHRVMEGQD